MHVVSAPEWSRGRAFMRAEPGNPLDGELFGRSDVTSHSSIGGNPAGWLEAGPPCSSIERALADPRRSLVQLMRCGRELHAQSGTAADGHETRLAPSVRRGGRAEDNARQQLITERSRRGEAPQPPIEAARFGVESRSAVIPLLRGPRRRMRRLSRFVAATFSWDVG